MLQGLPSNYYPNAAKRRELENDVINGKYDPVITLRHDEMRAISRAAGAAMSLTRSGRTNFYAAFPVALVRLPIKYRGILYKIMFRVFPIDRDGNFCSSAVTARPMYFIDININVNTREYSVNNYLASILTIRAVSINNPAHVNRIYRCMYRRVTPLELLVTLAAVVPQSTGRRLICVMGAATMICDERLEFVLRGAGGEDILMNVYIGTENAIIARILIVPPRGSTRLVYNVLATRGHVAFDVDDSKLVITNKSTIIRQEAQEYAWALRNTLKKNILVCATAEHSRAALAMLHRSARGNVDCIRYLSSHGDGVGITKIKPSDVTAYNKIIGGAKRALLWRLAAENMLASTREIVEVTGDGLVRVVFCARKK